MSELLTGSSQAQELRGQMVISITGDEEVLAEIPQETCDMLMDKGQKIFMAGMFKTYHVLVNGQHTIYITIPTNCCLGWHQQSHLRADLRVWSASGCLLD